MSETVVIVSDSTAARVSIQKDSSDALNIISAPAGAGLDGYPVLVDTPKLGDVISFNGAVFANRAQVELTDGGNF